MLKYLGSGPAVPRARMLPFLAACGGDRERAVALYRWNREVWSALFEVLLEFEVPVRTAMDDQLRRWNSAVGGGPDWVGSPAAPLNLLVSSAMAGAARRKAAGECGCAEACVPLDEVSAQLPFGFWCSLLPDPVLLRSRADPGPRQTARRIVWVHAVSRAFPGITEDDEVGLRQVVDPLRRLHRVRNRIAHGGDVLRADPVGCFHEMLEVSRLIDPVLVGALREISRVEEVASRDPRVG